MAGLKKELKKQKKRWGSQIKETQEKFAYDAFMDLYGDPVPVYEEIFCMKKSKVMYQYLCLCGNVVFASRSDLRMKCGRNHAGNVKMLCEKQWTKPDAKKT